MMTTYSDGMITMEEHLFETTAALDAALCDSVTGKLKAAIARRGQAVLVLSGGRTPLSLFALLSKVEIDWGKVIITLADERWVSTDHNDSNARALAENLLVGRASASTFVSLYCDQPSARKGVEVIAERLHFLDRPADIVLLGMGEDGHTASLFPGADQIDAALDPEGCAKVAAITPLAAPHERMTLTLPVLAATDCLIVHITGAKKRQLLEQIRAGDMDLPIGRVLAGARHQPHLFWAG